MQRESTRSSQLGLTSGIHRETSEFIAMSAPERARRGGRRGKLWILTEPASSTGGASAAAKLVMETIEDEYYNSPAPSITTALEDAIQAANRLLHDYNAGAPLHKQAYLGVTCAVTHGKDLYVAQVQPARAIVVHQGSPRTFPDGPPRQEEDLTPLGLDSRVEVELYRSPFTPGDTVTLLSAGLARLIGRAEDEYGLSYKDHAGATAYLSHLAARENLLDEHALVVEEPARRPSGGSLEKLGREWVRGKVERSAGPLRQVASRLGKSGAEAKASSQGAVSWIRQKQADAPKLPFSLPTASAQLARGNPSKLQVVSTLIGVALLLLLAVGLGTRAYKGYRQTTQFESLVAAAQTERQQARGKSTQEAMRHLEAAEQNLTQAQRLLPEDRRTRAELARLQADRDAMNKVERLSRLTSLGKLPVSKRATYTKLIVVAKNALLLDGATGTIRMYDLGGKRASVLAPNASVRFVGLSWREGGVLGLDRTGRVWDYDHSSKEWNSVKLGGNVRWADVVGFDTYGTRAFVAVKGRKEVLAYSLSAPSQPKVLRSNIKGQPLMPASLSADGNLWLIQSRDDSIWKLSDDRVTRRIWVDAEPRIEGAFGLVTLDTNKYLYMLDKKQERVLKIAPNGQLHSQIHLPREFKGAERIAAVYPDEAAGQLYLVVDGALYKAPLAKPAPPQ